MKRWERPDTDEVDLAIPMSLGEYLSSRFRPDMDYYDGAARERNRAFWPHSATMNAVGLAITPRNVDLSRFRIVCFGYQR